MGGVIPKEYIKPVDDGIRLAMNNGPVCGYPVGGRQGHPHRRLVPPGGFQ